MVKILQHLKPVLGLLSWDTKTSATGIDMCTYESAGYSSKFDNPMLSAEARFPSTSGAFQPSHL